MDGSSICIASAELGSMEWCMGAVMALAIVSAAMASARLAVRTIVVLVLARGRRLSGGQYLALIALVLDRRHSRGASKAGSASERAG